MLIFIQAISWLRPMRPIVLLPLLIGINPVGTRITGNTVKPLIRLSIMESGTLNIYRDLLTSLSVMTLGASMPSLLDANNRKNVRRDSGCAFSKGRASVYLDDSIERSSRSDSKITPLRTFLRQ